MMRLPIVAAILTLATIVMAAETTTTEVKAVDDSKSTVTLDNGAIVRGPREEKLIALEFTGGNFADGGTIILDTLKERNAKASFFFLGDFFRKREFHPLIKRILAEGHYLGPHSDKHPLYASWENPPKLLISKEEFDKDLIANMETMKDLFGIEKQDARYFIPPYEHYTQEIADWTSEHDMVLINLTRGTRSHADYMQDDDPKYVTSEEMVKSILDYEKKDPDGMNGFMLLMHVGAGPGRTKDHLYNHLGELMDELAKRGYRFVRIDELLEKAPNGH